MNTLNRGKSCRAVFLDRDGVINQDHGYVYKKEEFDFIPGSLKAMKLLSELNFRIIIITNQAGIARGYYNEQDLLALNNWLHDIFQSNQIDLLKIYYCPHHPEFQKNECSCRKPKPGMIIKATEEFNIDIENSLLVGDKLSDIECGRSAGINRCYLISSKWFYHDILPEGVTNIYSSLLELVEKEIIIDERIVN